MKKREKFKNLINQSINNIHHLPTDISAILNKQKTSTRADGTRAWGCSHSHFSSNAVTSYVTTTFFFRWEAIYFEEKQSIWTAGKSRFCIYMQVRSFIAKVMQKRHMKYPWWGKSVWKPSFNRHIFSWHDKITILKHGAVKIHSKFDFFNLEVITKFPRFF